MGRPRTPSNVLQLKGAFAKDPARGRARADEMEVVGEVGDPPEWLDESAQVAWRELVGMVPGGCLGRSDAAHLAVVSKLYALVKVTPTLDIPPSVLQRLMVGLGSMGMNPSERSKVKIGKGPAVNEFADLD